MALNFNKAKPQANPATPATAPAAAPAPAVAAPVAAPAARPTLFQGGARPAARPGVPVARGGILPPRAAPPAPAPVVVTDSVLFAGMREAQPAFQANYVKPGKYVMRIDAVKRGTTRKLIPFVVVELTVIHVIALDQSHPGHRVLETCSYMMQYGDYFLRNMKAFVCGVMNCASEEVGEEECAQIVSDVQPLAGKLVLIDAVNRMTKPTEKRPEGGEITNVKFEQELSYTDLAGMLNPEDMPTLNAAFGEGVFEQMVLAEQQAG